MSALIIQNPDNVPGAVTTGYQLQNTVLFAAMTGFVNTAIDRINRRIRQGSVFELDGNIVRVTADVGIGGTLFPNNINFVYAIPAGDGIVNFQFSMTPPTWNANKGGWYRGSTNERALMTAVTDSANLITGAMTMSNELDTIVPPNSGGVSVGTWNTRTRASIQLNRGWHRFVITSGLGGGTGGSNSGNTGGGGSVPSISNSINGVFFHQGGVLIVHVGGNGFLGANGVGFSGGGAGGTGGGSGAGEESFIISGGMKFSTERVQPGNGGSRGGIGSIPGGISTIERISFPNNMNASRYPLGDATERILESTAPQNDAGWGGFGIVGGMEGTSGGGGGAPGWIRPLGDTSAGFVQIWRLS